MYLQTEKVWLVSDVFCSCQATKNMIQSGRVASDDCISLGWSERQAQESDALRLVLAMCRSILFLVCFISDVLRL